MSYHKTSVVETESLVQRARTKLLNESRQSEHKLRLLVGHAMLLDSLMHRLEVAEEEQERSFNQYSSRREAYSDEEPSIEWAETIIEEFEEGMEADDCMVVDRHITVTDSSSEDEDDDADEDWEMEWDEEECDCTQVRDATIISVAEIDSDIEELEDKLECDGKFGLSPILSRRPPLRRLVGR